MESKRSLILQWIEQGALKKEQAEEILTVLGISPDGMRWRNFIENLLLWLGGLALAFSMMFFIAYNWDAMGRFAKFALVQFFIVVCVAAYWKLEVDKVTAKVSLMMATILLGVLLALYGQTYQTGADTWQLFANWALLMLPWALIARFAAIWLTWIVLLNISIVLYFKTVGSFFWFVFDSVDHVFWVLFIFNSLAWLAWELTAKRLLWLRERWTVWLLAVASGSAITILILITIFDKHNSEVLATLCYVSWLAILYFVYRRLIPDLFMLAGLCFSLVITVTSFFAHHLLAGRDSLGDFFILTLIVISMTGLAAKWLKDIQKEMAS